MKPGLGLMRPGDRVALVLAGVTCILHLAVAGRYDVFGDELYFIVCGRHPAFGYADQPPLVPLLSALLYAAGGHVWVLRLPAVAAAGLLVWVTICFARLLGGSDRAAWVGGLAAAGAPMLMSLTAIFSTATFEPLAWTLAAYLIARAVVLDDKRSFLWAGLVAGVAMQTKYAIPLWIFGLGCGVLATSERRLLARPELWAGLGIALCVAAPSLVWQALHGWPFLDLIKDARGKNIVTNPGQYLMRLVWGMNIVMAPVWMAGAVAPFFVRRLQQARYLSFAFILVLAMNFVLRGKDYYAAAAFPAMFAVGGVAVEAVLENSAIRRIFLAAALLVSAMAAPLVLPILSPGFLIAYETQFGLAVPKQLTLEIPSDLPIVFGFQFGWHDFAREVARAYGTLPAEERRQTAILVDDYAEAGAIDVYGSGYGLPPALSGHNQYFFWALRGQTPANILYVHGSEIWRGQPLSPAGTSCTSVANLGLTDSRFAMGFEKGKTISLCKGMKPTLEAIWPSLRFIY